MKLLHSVGTMWALIVSAAALATATDAALCPGGDSTPATPTPTEPTPAPTTATPVTPPPPTAPPPVSFVRVISPTSTITITSPEVNVCYRLDACSVSAYNKFAILNLKQGDNLWSLGFYSDTNCKQFVTSLDRPKNDRPVIADNTTSNAGQFKSIIVYRPPQAVISSTVTVPCS